MKVAWFSCGISSFMAAHFEPDSELIRIRIDDEHSDNDRFQRDAESVLCRKVRVLQSPYGSVDSVARSTRFPMGPNGAACSRVLKVRVRRDWENEHPGRHCYVWGFDLREKERFERLIERIPEHDHCAPLIDRFLTKEDVHALFARRFSIRKPSMYALGFRNNNCLGCLKGGAGYWNKIKSEFPEVFESRAKLEEDLGRTILRDKGLRDLLPSDGRNEEITPSCGLACWMAL